MLLALERLKRSFGQIFIISHVGEVQESALVDEVWLVEEDEDGKSLVRRMDARRGGGGLEAACSKAETGRPQEKKAEARGSRRGPLSWTVDFGR